mmetsp:Transcript_4785/g.6917  ORF Transcript_4785/g.6917 Transcript_4785/m.6917 type:complete len:205 (-) Transcript_4785:1879-2493(-)
MKIINQISIISLLSSSIEGYLHRTTPSGVPSPFVGSKGLSASTDILEVGDEDEDVTPGQMRISEIKAELKMRAVQFDDCFDKESLVERLNEARATGRANPDILNEFNKKKLEENFAGKKNEVSDEDLEKIKANDGTLPGGMNPEMAKKLMGNPEVMALLQSTKMQKAMKLMMLGGPEDLEKALSKDPELLEVVEKLNTIMKGAL